MPHLILYVHDLRSSGVVRNALLLARRIGRAFPTTLVAGHGEGHFIDEARRRDGFALEVLAPGAGALPRLEAVPALRRWLRTRPPSVLLSMGNHGHATPYLACRGFDHIRRIYRISNGVEREDGWRSTIRRRWMALLIRDAARIVLVGAATGALPIFARALASGLAVRIANGIDVDRAMALAASPAPHPWLEDKAIPVALGIGRLRPQKNFDLLIEGIARARRERRMRLAIIGGGSADERARLAALAAAAGLGQDFLLAGETDNVFAWLARSATFVLPSRWEGSSLALLEALAVGTPVVASRLAGDAATVLGEGRYGRLFDGADADALASAVLAQLSEAAVRPGARGLDYGVSADAYARLIQQVAVEHRAAAGVRDGACAAA